MYLLDDGTFVLSRICFVSASEAYPPYPPFNCHLGSFGVFFLGKSPVCKLETQPEFLQGKKGRFYWKNPRESQVPSRVPP